MTGDEFARLLSDFTRSAEAGDGARFARHFTEDPTYYDDIYGAHKGRGGVAMAQLGVEPVRMTKVFRRWTAWLKEWPETVDYLARPNGSRTKASRLKNLKWTTTRCRR